MSTMNGFLHDLLSPSQVPNPCLAFIRSLVLVHFQCECTSGVRVLLHTLNDDVPLMLPVPSACHSDTSPTCLCFWRKDNTSCVCPAFWDLLTSALHCSLQIQFHPQFYTYCSLFALASHLWYRCLFVCLFVSSVLWLWEGSIFSSDEKSSLKLYLYAEICVLFFFRFLLNCNFFISMSVNSLLGYDSMSTHIKEQL